MIDPDRMTQDERRRWLIDALLAEHEQYAEIEVPVSPTEQRLLLRALFNVRPPDPVSVDFLLVQDAYLRERTDEKGITRAADLPELEPGISVWRGDITTLEVMAIVNAANSYLLGCFHPNHGCIDNAIHTFAGVQLRRACAELMRAWPAGELPTGEAEITSGYNLPAGCVIHTVGPIVGAFVTERDRALLRRCYQNCLELARAQEITQLAFCCISTGEFRFPNQEAAEIAVETVRTFQREHDDTPRVVFNVFKEEDEAIYRALLG